MTSGGGLPIIWALKCPIETPYFVTIRNTSILNRNPPRYTAVNTVSYFYIIFGQFATSEKNTSHFVEPASTLFFYCQKWRAGA